MRFFKSVFNLVNRKISSGQKRTVTAKKNILGSIAIRGASIAISLVMVPITIEYVDSSRYGVWITISSIVGWFSFFNVGLTDGLRNKFAEARTQGNDEQAQVYVSTTYAILSIIFSLVWIVFILIQPFLDWADIVNIGNEYSREVGVLALIVFTYFCLQFVLKIVSTLIIADQKPALSSLIDLGGQIFSLLFIFILVWTTDGSLIYLGIGLCVSPILVLFASNIYFFRGRYARYAPRFSKVSLKESKGLFNLGFTFFVIQIAALIQYQTANIIIAQSFGPTQVTSYAVVYKYFSILTMAFGIFLSPFWSASTEAFLKKEISWIKKAVNKYLQLSVGFMGVGLLMLYFSDDIYRAWLKENVDIDFNLSLWGYFYVCSFLIGSLFVNLLNGISALRIQFISSMITPFVYIGTALLLINWGNMGPSALFAASIVGNLNGIIIAPIQYFQVIYKGKRGIWIK